MSAAKAHRPVARQPSARSPAGVDPALLAVGDLLEAVPDALLGVDRTGAICFVNRRAERLFGYERGALLGEPVETLVPQSFRESHRQQREDYDRRPRVRPMGTPLSLRGVRADGSEFPADVALSPVDTEGGTLVIAAVRDMTARQQREAVRLREARLLAIVEDSQDAIAAATLEGVVTSWNPAAQEMLGYHADEVVGRPVTALVPDEQAGELNAVLSQIADGGQVDRQQAVLLHQDGHPVQVDLSLSPVRDAGGQVTGVSAIAHDVTEARQAFEAARSMLETSRDALVAISPDGRITDANEATVALTGTPRAELIGTSFSDYFTDPARADEVYREALADGPAGDYQLTMRHNRGHEVLTEVLYNASVYRDPLGSVLGVFASARDVTDANRALAEAQEMAAIVQSSDDAIIGATTDGVITSWNPAAERLYGYPASEAIGQSGAMLSPPERREEFAANVAKTRAGGEVKRLETTRVRKDGTPFPVSLTISPIRGEDGEVAGTAVIARDLTATRAQQAAERRLAAIVQSSDDAIVGATPDGVIASWNPAATRVYGYTEQEVVGKPAVVMAPPEHAEEFASDLNAVATGHPLEHKEVTQVRKDGTRFPAALTLSPIYDDGGQVTGAAAIARDVSAERALAGSARSMIEASLDSLVAISPQGRITDANEATVAMTGVPRDKLIGTSFSEYFTDPGRAEVAYQQALGDGPVTDYPLTLQHHNGKDAVIEVLYNAASYHDGEGNVLGVFAAARDLTNLLAAQAEVSAQQAVDRARLAELERFQRLVVGRELKMIELKQEIEDLREQLGYLGRG